MTTMPKAQDYREDQSIGIIFIDCVHAKHLGGLPFSNQLIIIITVIIYLTVGSFSPQKTSFKITLEIHITCFKKCSFRLVLASQIEIKPLHHVILRFHLESTGWWFPFKFNHKHPEGCWDGLLSHHHQSVSPSKAETYLSCDHHLPYAQHLACILEWSLGKDHISCITIEPSTQTQPHSFSSFTTKPTEIFFVKHIKAPSGEQTKTETYATLKYVQES